MEWVSLIVQVLGPLLMNCFQKTSSDDPRQFLRDHYDSVTDTFSGNLVEDAMPQTYRAIRIARRRTPRQNRSNFPQYSRDQVVQMTKDHLKQSMNASDDQLKACKLLADQVQDSDD